MNECDEYKDKIIRLIYSIDDVKTLKMIYSLISKLLAIDDERILDIATRLIIGISRQ